jgi:hypothetical protein
VLGITTSAGWLGSLQKGVEEMTHHRILRECGGKEIVFKHP